MSFVDTSFWVGLSNERDGRHADAVALWAKQSRQLVTSNLIVGETWTYLQRHLHRSAALQFLDLMQQSRKVRVVRIDAPVERDAWTWLRRHGEREYSFVDATSFALMRRNKIRQALAFDGDFSAAGFVELRP